MSALTDLLQRDHVTFAEVSRLPGAKGDTAMMLKGDKFSNIVLWPNLSHEIVTEIKALLADGTVELKPTIVLTYLIDGVTCKLPLVKAVRHYESPHWFPVVLKLKNKSVLSSTHQKVAVKTCTA